MSQQYSQFNEKKRALVDLINKSSNILGQISLPRYAEILKQLASKIDNDTFKIQIVGTFKNGKSTFINALLGEDILPTKPLPCTAVINEIKYGEQKKAILHFRNPLPEPLLSDIPAATLKHMRTHGMKNIPPMEIPYDRIADYVTIPLDGDPKEISYMSPYLSVELFYPSALLKEGVEIIDSPGLNENDVRTAVTMDYLDEADAIIFMLDAIRPCAQDEMETVSDTLVPKGFDDMFFVVNRFDCIEKNQRADVKRFIHNHVKDFTTNDVYCISALEAVRAKLSNNEEKLAESGFIEFENRLALFLTKDKGKFKLVRPAKELKNIIEKETLFNVIPSQRAQLTTSLQTLQNRYASIQPQLAINESKKESLVRNLELKVERKENSIKRAISTQVTEIANQIPAWVEEFKPKNKPGVWARKSQVEKIKEEICEHINVKVKESFGKWSADVLTPLIEESIVEIFETSDNELKSILDEIDQMQSILSGIPVTENTASGWTRALGITGICVGLTSGVTLLTGEFDFKTLAKSIAVDIAIVGLLNVLVLTQPIIALLAIVGAVWNAIRNGESTVIRRLKAQIAPEIRNSIMNNRETVAEDVISKINDMFNKYIHAATEAIDMMIGDLKSQIKALMTEKEKGQKETNSRLELLSHSETKLRNICTELDSFVFNLIEQS